MNTYKCEECGKEIDPKYEGIELCAKCDEKNWITDPVEVQKEILKDPVLKNLVSHRIK